MPYDAIFIPLTCQQPKLELTIMRSAILCSQRFGPTKYISMHMIPRKHVLVLYAHVCKIYKTDLKYCFVTYLQCFLNTILCCPLRQSFINDTYWLDFFYLKETLIHISTYIVKYIKLLFGESKSILFDELIIFNRTYMDNLKHSTLLQNMNILIEENDIWTHSFAIY